tara:strand:+ start:3021 stop:3260 length:240 start_codon:yes stop_codon:yes gene_type:complete
MTKIKRARIKWSEVNCFEVELDVPENIDEGDIFEYYYFGKDLNRTWVIDVIKSRNVDPDSVEVELLSDSVETAPRGFDE